MYKFSIIIPTYNRALLLKRCLESLCNQTYKNFEVIVCDDGSTDGSEEVIREFENKLHLRYIYKENWGGPARPRNNGIKESSGEWICFLDSDDWWREDKLEKCKPFLEDYDFIYHDLVMLSESTLSEIEKAFVFKARSLQGNIVRDLLINGNPIANSSVVIRKTIIDLVGEITEDRGLIAIEDFDYWIRTTFHTNKFLYIGESLGYYWIGDNISQGLSHIHKEEYFLKKHIHKLSITDQQTARKVLNYRIARLYHINNEYLKASTNYLKAITTKAQIKYFFKPIAGILLAILHVKK
jgi:glycosyltransferase involved in cell wall biosynthesis